MGSLMQHVGPLANALMGPSLTSMMGAGGGMFGPQMGGMPSQPQKTSQASGIAGDVGAGLGLASMIPGPQQPFVMGASVLSDIISKFL